MKCAECETPIRVTMYAKNRDKESTGLRCPRCGTVHGYFKGEAWRISPPMLPLGEGLILSPWMLTRTRPTRTGAYECRFRNLEPDGKLTLWWNGHYFQVSQEDKRPVRMREFLSWRGSWE